jgi:hypothetical protein
MNALRWEGLPEIDPCVVRCGSGPPGYGTHQDGYGRHGVRGHGHGSHHGHGRHLQSLANAHATLVS